MMRCGDVQNWTSLRVGKGTTVVRHFHEFFRMRLHVIKILWDLLLRDNVLPEGGHPKHLHWDFYFFKVYPSKQSQGCSAVVASPTARLTQRPPSAKWVWAFIDTIVECFHMVVSKSRRELGWQCRRHVGDMSARQPNVGTFGRLGPVVPTQN